MKAKTFFPAVVAIATFTAISCNKESIPFSSYEGQDGKPVYVISSLSNAPKIKECGSDGLIVFQGKTIKNQLTEGAIICSEPQENAPYGFFARIKKISVKGEDTYIETESASLNEAIKEGSASADNSIAELFDTIEDGEGVVIKSGETKVDVNSGIELPISVKIAKVDSLDISFSGSFSLKGNIHIDMFFYNWELQRFDFWAQPEVGLKLDIDAKASKAIPIFETEKPLFRVKLRPIKFIVYGIPVVIVPIIEVTLKIQLDGSITLGCELLKVNYKYKAGATYIEEKGWSLINESSWTPPSILSNWKTFDMKGGLTIDFVNSFIPAFYGYDPSWDPKRRAQYNINVSAPIKIQLSDFDFFDVAEGYFNPRMKASWGINVGADFKLKILSKKLADFSPKVKLFETVLLDKHLFPRYSPVTTTDLGGGRVQVSYSMIDLNDCLFTDLKDHGVYWKKGKWPNNLKNGTEHWASLGRVDLDGVMPIASNRHHDFYVILDNLDINTTYTVWPYCVDQFTGREHCADISHFDIKNENILMNLCPDDNHPHAIDLGLSVKWACCNVGASRPTDYGDYYAWGEIEPYYSSLGLEEPGSNYYVATWKDGKSEGYWWTSYRWCNGIDYSLNPLLTKYTYCDLYVNGDGKTVLEPEDDAAQANWGNSWRMPTDEEWTELREQCTLEWISSWQWIIQSDKNAYKVTGPNGNSIFFPDAGYYWIRDVQVPFGYGEGNYWSSSRGPSYGGMDHAYSVNFFEYADYDGPEHDYKRQATDRYSGLSVRPVI